MKVGRFASLRLRVARWVAPSLPRGAARQYAASRGSRTTGGFGGSGDSSADAELSSSLAQLRARSRQMVRDSSYAKRARVVIQNNVIGAGVGMQAQCMTTRGDLADRINSEIEAAYATWCEAEFCHIGGELHFHDMERLLSGEVFEAGEVLVRMHFTKVGASAVPLTLEVIEAERLADDLIAPAAIDAERDVRMGVERDRYGRPVAYWIRERHPGDLRSPATRADRYERVPAEQIFHLRIVERWPQTRGVPWLHTALRKLDDMNEYTGLEVTAARGSASYFATIESPDAEPLKDDEEDDGKAVMDIDPLTIQELKPGEKLTFHNPTRPNAALDPFMRAMLREVAAGAGPSYASISRDYSQSTYSSERVAQLDDRDLYRVLQQWWLRSFRHRLHKVWLRQAVLAGAIPSISVEQYALNTAKFEAVLFKPRGWTWVDPTKEVKAFKEAIRAGFTTTTDVIAQTAGGLDIEDTVRTRRRELDLFAKNEINVDTTVQASARAGAPGTKATGAEDAPPPAGRVLHVAARSSS